MYGNEISWLNYHSNDVLETVDSKMEKIFNEFRKFINKAKDINVSLLTIHISLNIRHFI